MRDIANKSHFTIDPLICDGCKLEFYHAVINERQPTQHWCMWCFGERFGVEAMERQYHYYKKQKIHEAGVPMNLLWEYPTEHFKRYGYEAKTISEMTLEDFNLLNRKDNDEGVVK